MRQSLGRVSHDLIAQAQASLDAGVELTAIEARDVVAFGSACARAHEAQVVSDRLAALAALCSLTVFTCGDGSALRSSCILT